MLKYDCFKAKKDFELNIKRYDKNEKIQLFENEIYSLNFLGDECYSLLNSLITYDWIEIIEVKYSKSLFIIPGR